MKRILHIVTDEEAEGIVRCDQFEPILEKLGIEALPMTMDYREDRCVYDSNPIIPGVFTPRFPPGRWVSFYPQAGVVTDANNIGNVLPKRTLDVYLMDPEGELNPIHSYMPNTNDNYLHSCSESHSQLIKVHRTMERSREFFDEIPQSHFYVNEYGFPYDYSNISPDDLENMLWLHDKVLGEVISGQDNHLIKIFFTSLIKQNQEEFYHAYERSRFANVMSA